MIDDTKRADVARRTLRLEYGTIVPQESEEDPVSVLRDKMREEVIASRDAIDTARLCTASTCREIYGLLVRGAAHTRVACPFCGAPVPSYSVPLDMGAIQARGQDGLERVRGKYARGEAKAQWRVALYYFTVFHLRLFDGDSFAKWLDRGPHPRYRHARNLVLLVEEGFREDDFCQFGQSRLIALTSASLSREERARVLLEIGDANYSVEDVRRRCEEIRAERLLAESTVDVPVADLESDTDSDVRKRESVPNTGSKSAAEPTEITLVLTIPVKGIALPARNDRIDGHETESEFSSADGDYCDVVAGERYALRIDAWVVKGRTMGVRLFPVEVKRVRELVDDVDLDPAENDP